MLNSSEQIVVSENAEHVANGLEKDEQEEQEEQEEVEYCLDDKPQRVGVEASRDG